MRYCWRNGTISGAVHGRDTVEMQLTPRWLEPGRCLVVRSSRKRGGGAGPTGRLRLPPHPRCPLGSLWETANRSCAQFRQSCKFGLVCSKPPIILLWLFPRLIRCVRMWWRRESRKPNSDPCNINPKWLADSSFELWNVKNFHRHRSQWRL